MRGPTPIVLLLLCGGALAASPRGELQKKSDTPASATAVEAPAEAAPEEGAAGENKREPWFPGAFGPNPGFYPRQWWGNNHANYAAFGGFGGRSGFSPFAGFSNPMQYMRQMQWFSNDLPDVINTGAQNRFF